MNKLEVNQVGGFPLTTRILDELQKAYTLFNALGAIVGDFTIISGCTVTGSNVSDGVVFINGEVLEFRGGLAQTKVIIKQDVENLTFQNGNANPVIKTRYVAFGSGVGAIDWANFKRGYLTKDIAAALADKVDNTTLDALQLKITQLEKKTAVFQTGGGMVLWQKPANQIPVGWQEVVDWRGRFPVGHDGSQTEFDTLGKADGAKDVQLIAGNIPELIVTTPYTAGGDTGGGFIATGNATEGPLTVGKTPNGTTKVKILNPYRVVMFIEYVG